MPGQSTGSSYGMTSELSSANLLRSRIRRGQPHNSQANPPGKLRAGVRGAEGIGVFRLRQMTLPLGRDQVASMQGFMDRVRSAGRGLLGTWVKIPAFETVELLAHAGFDFVVIDMEHSPLALDRVYELIFATQRMGMAAPGAPARSAGHTCAAAARCRCRWPAGAPGHQHGDRGRQLPRAWSSVQPVSADWASPRPGAGVSCRSLNISSTATGNACA